MSAPNYFLIVMFIMQYFFLNPNIFVSWIGCAPTKCGRAVLDNVVSAEESDKLLALAKKGFAKGGGSGGASILDLHSGAISKVHSTNNFHIIIFINKPT